MEEKRISLKIDLRSGTIELDAPADAFDEAIARTKELAESLDFRQGRPAPVSGAPSSGMEEEPNPDSPAARVAPAPPGASSTRTRVRASKASAARPGRIGSFEEVKGLLSEEQQIELRRFYSEKAPREQPHQVLAAMVKGEQLLSRRGFGYNEIYTLMWLAGAKPLPRALDVVLLKMSQDQLIVREESGFAVKFIGRDFVENELPKALDKQSNGSAR